MKPYNHARNSAKKWGGKPEDYIEIHNFIDSSKATMPDIRHRAILHSAFGIFIVEKVFGVTMKNSNGTVISVRDIAEDHVVEDLGHIPTVEHYLKHLPIMDWMGGAVRGGKKSKFIPID